MNDSSRYIMYRTAASGSEAVGYVVNVFVWDGQGKELPIPDGMAIAADPTGVHPIGSIYTASS